MRRASVAFFLGDPAFLADTKFRALARRLPDADDFNAAVGAYWIVVAACRRNGSPVIDAEDETESRHIDALRQVGLLTDEGLPRAAFEAWAPMSPQQAAAGKARSDQADAAGLRDERGQFTKVPTPSSEPSALVPLASADQPSPPLPSTHVKDDDEEEDDVESLDGREAESEGPALTWLARHGCAIRPGNGYHQNLVTAVERHGVIALIRGLEELSAAGVPNGDIKGLLFGAIDALDAAKRPGRGAVARAVGQAAASERTRRNVAATKRYIAEIQSVGDVDGSPDHGVIDPRGSS